MTAADLEWMAEAACRGVGPDRFHPVSAVQPVPPDIVEMCAACPVRGSCLDFGLSAPTVDPPAIYGGQLLTLSRARRLRRERGVRSTGSRRVWWERGG